MKTRKHIRMGVALASISIAASLAVAGPITVDYTEDAGGDNGNPLNGLAARAIFDVSGTSLTVRLQNTSTGAPAGADSADALLVSIGFILPDTVSIVTGDSATIGAGSTGFGGLSGLVGGDTVNDEWLWTNDAGGDLLSGFDQVISTSNGQGSGDETGFDGDTSPNVNGPSGGISAIPAAVPVGGLAGVSDEIIFQLTLSQTVSMSQLSTLANGARIEFGSDFQYLEAGEPMVPLPAGVLLTGAGLLGLGTIRRR